MSAAEESSRPPRQVGVYRLDAKIGSGAMGTVYRATHMTLGKEVALKLVHVEDPQGELCRRFLQEGIAASRVRHPNVVEVLDAGRYGDTAYLAMQLLDGETLSECLGRQGRLPVTYAIDLFLPVCAALIAAHQAGVLHRDLKPANIFLSEVGRGEPEPMLLDFGISKILGPVDAALTQNPRFLGTPLYIAPEQADGAPGSDLSDQYSLALSLYECLLGVRPYQKYASSLIQLLRRVAEGEIKAPRDLDASIPEELDEALCRALSVDPLDRFPSIREFGAALLPFASAARSTLWQHSFIDAERTMTSANAPVNNSRSSRRIHVSVDDGARISRPSEIPSSTPSPSLQEQSSLVLDNGDDDDSFMSHSALFGGATSDRGAHSDRFDSRDARLRRMERSSISRRTFPSTKKEELHDPYSQVPSGRPSSDSWSGYAREDRMSFSPDRNSIGVPTPSSWRNAHPKNSKLMWFFAGVLGLTTLSAAVVLIRFDLRQNKPTSYYPVAVESIPVSARIYLDGLQVGTGTFRAKFAHDGVLHRIRVSHPDYEDTVVAFQDEAPHPQIRLHPLLRPPEGASLNGSESPHRPQATLIKPDPGASRVVPKSSGTSPAPPKRVAVNASPSAEGDTSTKIIAAESVGAQVQTAAVVPNSSESIGPVPDAKILGSQIPAPKKSTPTSEKQERSIQTGNLDPWTK